jgi:DNA-binding response OmpR family regulator
MPEPIVLGERIGAKRQERNQTMALFRRKKRIIRRLLIVEYEPLVAFDNEHHLDKAGYDIAATVDSGEAAIALITRERVDAIVLDVRLAGESSGIDVARCAVGRGIAVLFVSGDCPDEAAGLARGALTKPYTPEQLIGALELIDRMLQGESVTEPNSGLRLFAGPAASDARFGRLERG